MSRKKKKERDRQKQRRHAPPTKLQLRLAEAQEMLSEGEFEEARELLASLDRTHPNDPEILRARMAEAVATNDEFLLHETAERLTRLRPSEPLPHLVLGQSCLMNGWPSLAMRTFRHFLSRWPSDPEAPKVQELVTQVERTLPEHLKKTGLTGENAFAHACLHEEILAHLSAGRTHEVHSLARQLLAVRPDFIPAMNNETEAYIIDGNSTAAIEMCRRVLALQPNNGHARGNLIRVLFLSGHHTEAITEAQSLKQLTFERDDEWAKVAETLSFLGDDEGVLTAAAHVRSDATPQLVGMVKHLAGVALCRLGREHEARKAWKEAIANDPGEGAAEENLAQLDLPIGERSAPWPFLFRRWIPNSTIAEISRQLSSQSSRKNESEALRQFLQRRPDVAALIPVLLNRGDPRACEFALRLAETVATPETLAILRDYALSQHGPDASRLKAANAASAAGLIPSGTVRMWTQGQWREVFLLNFEITDEPTEALPPRVSNLVARALELMRAGNADEAEPLLREALVAEPDCPAILNNLAVSFQMRGRNTEAEALSREIHRRFPDYLFGIIAVARLAIRDGRLDEAKALLDQVITRKRFHTTEYVALAAGEIDWHLAKGQHDGAVEWLKMLEEMVPDAHMLPDLRNRVHRNRSRWPFG